MAGPAPARSHRHASPKKRGGRAKQGTPEVPRWLRHWAAVPASIVPDLARRGLTYTEFLCVLLSFTECLGDPDKPPETDAITAEYCHERTGHSADACRKALSKAEDLRLLCRRPGGRSYWTGPNPEYYKALKAIPLAESEKRPSNTREARLQRRLDKRRARLVCPAGVAECPVALEADPDGRLVAPADTLIQLTDTGRVIPVSSLTTEQGQQDTVAQDATSAAASEPPFDPDPAPDAGAESVTPLTPAPPDAGAIQQVVAEVFGRPCDRQIAEATAGSLGGASAEDFRAELLRRAGAVKSHGFLPHIAEDTAKQRAAEVAKARAMWSRLNAADRELLLRDFPELKESP